MPLSRTAIVGLVLYGMFLAAGIAGLGSRRGGDPHLIKVVSSLPRTGSARTQTDSIVNGIKMAFEEVDYQVKCDNGEVFRIQYLDWDDATAAAGQWTAEAEAANADAAVKDPDVMVYIGTYNSGAAKVSMPTLNIAHLLMVSPANTAPGLTKSGTGDYGEPEIYRPTGKINFTRVVPADDLQGARAAEWAKDLGAKRIFILDDTEVYGRGVAQVFHARAEEIGLTILGHESIDVKANEFKSLLTTIKATNPDLLYFGGTTQSKGGQIAKEMLDVGLDIKFMGPDGCYETAFLEAAGPENLIGRAYVTFGGLPPEQTPKFTEAYMQRWDTKGKPPEGYAVYGYECGRVAIEAIKKAGKKDRSAILAAALSLEDFHGALGKGSFDENGDIKLDVISGFQVVSKKDKNGREVGDFKFVKRLMKTD
jgi:branched-chain amino acid transport system substrate-binding protein